MPCILGSHALVWLVVPVEFGRRMHAAPQPRLAAAPSANPCAPAPCLAQEMGTDEYGELMRLRQLKASYRDAHGELQAMRSEAEYNAGLVAACTRWGAEGWPL